MYKTAISSAKKMFPLLLGTLSATPAIHTSKYDLLFSPSCSTSYSYAKLIPILKRLFSEKSSFPFQKKISRNKNVGICLHEDPLPDRYPRRKYRNSDSSNNPSNTQVSTVTFRLFHKLHQYYTIGQEKKLN